MTNETSPECAGCGRAMLEQAVMLCGACREQMSDEDVRAQLPAMLGGDVWAAALVREGGTLRLVELELTPEQVEKAAVRRHEREFPPMVLPRVADLARAWADGMANE